jgi:AraC family carnitine catabolism transcriptional activator
LSQSVIGLLYNAMMETPLPRDLKDIAFVLLPKFSMIALMCALEPLRLANRFRPGSFSWRFLSVDGAEVRASNEIPVSAQGRLAAAAPPPDLAVICASYEPEKHLGNAVLNPVRALARKGTMLAGLDTGPFILAQAGLLDGYRATVHWESRAGFAETYPAVETTSAPYEIDRGRITCAGGAASIDMMLDLIERCHGRELAVAIADQLVHLRFAYGGDARLPAQVRLQVGNPRVGRIVEAMERNIENPLATAALAAIGGLSVRHMERLFRAHLGASPRLVYQGIRLDSAERLLRYSTMSVLDAAVACGFRSHAHFTRAYKARFGAPPSRHAGLRSRS